MNQACVSLDEVFAAAGARAASLVPETSGYLALAVADATSRLPYAHDDRAVLLTIDGTVMVPRKGTLTTPPEAARGLREVLRHLLAASSGSMPGLVSAARPRTDEQDIDRVVADVEAALIPVNRAAAKRALARLARETLRAKEMGKLKKKPALTAPPAAAAPQPAPAAAATTTAATVAPPVAAPTAPAPQSAAVPVIAPQIAAAPVVAPPIEIAPPPPPAPAATVVPVIAAAPVAESPFTTPPLPPPTAIAAPVIVPAPPVAESLFHTPPPPAFVTAPIVTPPPAAAMTVSPVVVAPAVVASAADANAHADEIEVEVEVGFEAADVDSGEAAAAASEAETAAFKAVAPEPQWQEADATIADPDAMAVFESALHESLTDGAGTIVTATVDEIELGAQALGAQAHDHEQDDDALTRPWSGGAVLVASAGTIVITPALSAPVTSVAAIAFAPDFATPSAPVSTGSIAEPTPAPHAAPTHAAPTFLAEASPAPAAPAPAPALHAAALASSAPALAPTLPHDSIFTEPGNTRADELLGAFRTEGDGDEALLAAAGSLRAYADIHMTPPPRSAAPRSAFRSSPPLSRRTGPALPDLDDDLPLPAPRARASSSGSRLPLAIFALGVLVLFAAWLYRPTLARDFFGLRQLIAPAPAPSPAAAPPALGDPALRPPAASPPARSRDARASDAPGDGARRRRD